MRCPEIENLITDTGLVLILRWIVAVIFVAGSVHKFRSPSAFIATMNGYRLLPSALATPAAYLLMTAELITAATLILNMRLGSVLALLLLTLYTTAIGINLARGRRDIDCGCAGPAVRQTLSTRLLLRNLVFMAMVLVTMLPASAPRGLGLLDWFTAVVAATTFALILSAATHLSSVSSRFGH